MDVKKSDGMVWIDGVGGFSPAEYASSPHGCQARVMQALGESVSYADLVCFSGFAFRVEVHEGMCPSAGHPACGYMCMDGSVRSLPRRAKGFESFPWSEPKKDSGQFETSARRAIKNSIDKGIPAVYCGEEDGLIIGYGDGGSRWRCLHPYYKEGREAFWHDEAKGFAGGKWPWAIYLWTEPKSDDERESEHALTISAFRQAVEMWETSKIEAYFIGEAAYRHWLDWLRNVNRGRIEDPKSGMGGNGWCYDVLIQNRRIAGTWLREKAKDFTGETAAKLRKAAGNYAKIAELCMMELESSWDLAPGPDKFEIWTEALRNNQIERLEASYELDRNTISLFKTLPELPQ